MAIKKLLVIAVLAVGPIFAGCSSGEDEMATAKKQLEKESQNRSTTSEVGGKKGQFDRQADRN